MRETEDFFFFSTLGIAERVRVDSGVAQLRSC